MAADVLAPDVAKASAAMLLTLQDKEVLVIHKERFQLSSSSQIWEMIDNTNIY